MSYNEKNRLVLASFLAQCGLGSRRACKKIIAAGQIRINGSTVNVLNTFIQPGHDRITYKGSLLEIEKKRYMLVHKPLDYVCTSKDKHAHKLVFDLLQPRPEERLFTIGRLDKNSEGLLLLTNDGEFANNLTHPRYGVEKTYSVEVSGQIRKSDMRQLESGITDDGELLKAASAEITHRKPHGGTLKLIIKEGRKREIRRMCSTLNYSVKRLIRTAIGPLKLGTFRPGYYRDLSDKEISMLKHLRG